MRSSVLGQSNPMEWIQQGPKLHSRWMVPIENRLDEGWSEQAESQNATDIRLVDLRGGGKLRNRSICSLFNHPPPAVRAGYRLHQCAVDACPRGRPCARAVRSKHDLAAAPSVYLQRNVDR